MKAWIVTTTDPDDGGEFVLADTRGQAKYYSRMTTWADWTELRARRIPELDGIQHPTDWDWYSRVKNWRHSFCCAECGNEVDLDGGEFVFSEGGWIFHESCINEHNKMVDDFEEDRKRFDAIMIGEIENILHDL